MDICLPMTWTEARVSVVRREQEVTIRQITLLCVGRGSMLQEQSMMTGRTTA